MKTEKDYWTLLDRLDEIEVKKGIRLIDHSIDLENSSDAGLTEDDAGYWDYMYGSAKYWADVRAELYGVKL
jgi:hypothetical protein